MHIKTMLHFNTTPTKKKLYTPYQHTSSGTVAVKIQRYKMLAYDSVIFQREQ